MNEYFTLLVQVPLVGVFMWYSIKTQAAYQESLDRKDQAFLSSLRELSKSFDCLASKVDASMKTAGRRASGLKRKPDAGKE